MFTDHLPLELNLVRQLTQTHIGTTVGHRPQRLELQVHSMMMLCPLVYHIYGCLNSLLRRSLWLIISNRDIEIRQLNHGFQHLTLTQQQGILVLVHSRHRMNNRQVYG